MDKFCVVNHLKCKDLDGIKEFISREGDVLKIVPELGHKTLLNYILQKIDKSYMSDEIIHYLIDEETQARCAKYAWDGGKWNIYLFFALRNNYSENIVLKLIRSGCDNIFNFTIEARSIELAIRYKYNKEIIINMLKCCYEDKKQSGYLSLLSTAVESLSDNDVLKVLIGPGANLQAIKHHCGNIFKWIPCNPCDENGCKSKPTIHFLIKNGFDLKAVDDNRDTIIHVTNCRYLIKLAIKNGVSLEQKNILDFTPLMKAVYYVRKRFFGKGVNETNEKIDFLLQLGADPNSALNLYYMYVDRSRNHQLRISFRVFMRPLFLFAESAINGNLIQLLLYHGADCFTVTVNNNSLINYLLSSFPKFSGDLKDIVCYYMFFMDDYFCNHFPMFKNSDFWLSFFDNCKVEQDKMKSIVFNDGLTLYDFCNLKRYYKSEFVAISLTKLESNVTDNFPIYNNFIKIRIKDNASKRWYKILRDILESIVIVSVNNPEGMSQSVELNYDIIYYLSKFINSKDLYNVFLASTSD